MTPEQIKVLFALLGLEDGADFEAMKAKFAELTAKKDDTEPKNDDPEPNNSDQAPVNENNLVAALSEADVKKLSENPVTAKLLAAMEAQNKQLIEQGLQFKEMKIKETVSKLNETTAKTGRGLTPNTQTALTEIFRVADDKTASLVTKLFENFVNGSATVKLSEPRISDPSDRNNVKKFSDRVSEIAKEKNIEYREAALIAASEVDSDSFNTYRAGDE